MMHPLPKKFCSFFLEKRGFFPLLLGGLLAFAQAPFYGIPFLFISFSGLLWYIDQVPQRSLRSLFEIGWFFGVGFYSLGLYWIAYSLGVDIRHFWWLVPFSVLGLPAFFALWSGLALMIASLKIFKGMERTFICIILWSLGEWIRGHFLTGFPWNLMGYVWGFSTELLQMTSLMGIYGLTALTIFLACAPYLFFCRQRKKESLAIFICFLCFWGYGAWRLHEPSPGHHPNIVLRIVQPNIPQSLKWDFQKIQEHQKKLLTLSCSPAQRPITHVIWPESATPFFLEDDFIRRTEIAQALPKGAFLLTGGLRQHLVEKKNIDHIWNSFLVLNSSGNILATYDKTHLVPFGEYVPLRQWLPSLVQKVTQGSIDFSTGTGPKTLQIPTTPSFSPLVCYEGIFSGDVTSSQRPQWIVNVTNDAWFGDTSGPYQHFENIRVRAIEEGLPLVRAANTGISGLCDAYGRVEKKLALNSTGFIDAPLPKALPSPPLFVHIRHTFFWIFLIFLGIYTFLSRPSRRI